MIDSNCTRGDEDLKIWLTVELLCYTFETNIRLFINSTSIKKKEQRGGESRERLDSARLLKTCKAWGKKRKYHHSIMHLCIVSLHDYLEVIVLCECLWIDYLICAESIYVILKQRGLLLSKHFIPVLPLC